MRKNRSVIFAVLGFFTLVGTYNAMVINSHSGLHDVKFVKRLDENLGIIIPGRSVAGSMSWNKVQTHKKSVIAQENKQLETSASAPNIEIAEVAPATVQNELDLQLVEVMNPKKWQNGLAATQFSGNLETNDGVIESLSVSLPDTEPVSVSFSEMSGNVFQYEANGEAHSGMMYQVDESSYMVTLTTGPLEGTKLRFSSKQPEVQQQEIQETLAQNNVQVGSFGEPPLENEPQIVPEESLPAQETAQSTGFNFGPQSM